MKKLTVPIILSAYITKEDTDVVRLTNFSKIPFVGEEGDINSDIGYLGEEIASKPFMGSDFILKKGVHLHWQIPEMFKKGKVNDEKTKIEFPECPDRWLLIKTNKKTAETTKTVIESNYLFPEGIDKKGSAVSIPYNLENKKTQANTKQEQPFRFLGRSMDIEAWINKEITPSDGESEYLNSLNNVSSGQLSFSSFYPNCFSVFGYYDESTKEYDLPDIKYELVGWFSKKRFEKDPILEFLGRWQKKETKYQEIEEEGIEVPYTLKEALECEFSIKITEEKDLENIKETVYYSTIEFSESLENHNSKKLNSDITIAGNVIEAISAKLAEENSENNKDREELEEYLQIVQHSSHIRQSQADSKKIIEKQHHQNSFSPTKGEIYWEVKWKPLKENQKPEEQKPTPKLKKATKLKLNDLNKEQNELDKLIFEVEKLQRFLYASWYKYMTSTYPPQKNANNYPSIDKCKFIIEEKKIPLIEEKLEQIKTKKISLETIKHDLEDLLIQNEKTEDFKCELKEIPGPGYWQPKEPVVLLSGDLMESKTKKSPKKPKCICIEEESQDTIRNLVLNNKIDNIIDKIESIIFQEENEKIEDKFSQTAKTKITTQAWNPFMLEWEVQLFPHKFLEEIDNKEGIAFDEDIVLKNFEIPVQKQEIIRKENSDVSIESNLSFVFKGRCFLSGSTKLVLKEQLENFLKTKYEKTFKEEELPEKIEEILEKLENKNDAQDAELPMIKKLITIYRKLEEFDCLSQNLSQFNEILLQFKESITFGIDDPLAFPKYLDFTKKIKELVADQYYNAPSPLNPFLPLRSGVLKLLKLRIVDTFGQYSDINCDNITTPLKLQEHGHNNLFITPFRITQPARLGFRWIDNSSRDISPIYGWILPNYFNNSLMFFDSEGKGVGSIKSDGNWEKLPGQEIVTEKYEYIEDKNLKRIISYIIETNKKKDGKNFIRDLMNSIRSAQNNIEPEGENLNPIMSLLLGNPIALIRARVGFELKGEFYTNQNWKVFEKGVDRDTMYKKIKFPIRIGDYKQFNDGLIGYWIESNDKKIKSKFFSPQSDQSDSCYIDAYGNKKVDTLRKSMEEEPDILNILMDVRGVVNVYSGVLPAKEISVPLSYYEDAMKRISGSIFAAPILVPVEKHKIPLPKMEGMEWFLVDEGENNKEKLEEIKPETFDTLWNGEIEIIEKNLKLKQKQKKE